LIIIVASASGLKSFVQPVDAKTLAARSKRASRSGSDVNACGKTFSATWQFNLVSVT